MIAYDIPKKYPLDNMISHVTMIISCTFLPLHCRLWDLVASSATACGACSEHSAWENPEVSVVKQRGTVGINNGGMYHSDMI